MHATTNARAPARHSRPPLPLPGRVANVLFLSWLYAFYCFDYGWGLQGVPLPERIAFFERRWAFFAGGRGTGAGGAGHVEVAWSPLCEE